VREDEALLLARAREALKAEVLPHLPAERRYPALMAMTALGIAGRRAEGGAARRAEALAALAPFAAGARDLREAQALLARRLRMDPACATPELHAALLAAARAACAESNPKARALRGLPED
jgi:hypothetical protein